MAVPRKAISYKNFTGVYSRLTFGGLRHKSPSSILSFRRSQSSLKPSKISLRPEKPIDIALRGMAVPGAGLARPPQ